MTATTANRPAEPPIDRTDRLAMTAEVVRVAAGELHNILAEAEPVPRRADLAEALASLRKAERLIEPAGE